jgi:hypothetical protein
VIKLLKRRAPTLEEQLRVLEQCGIRCRPGITPEQLLAGRAAARFEADPFRLAVVALGAELGDFAPDGVDLECCSDDVWHFDTECIEDHGDYARIAARMSALAQGDLPLRSILDHVDLEEEVAWLEFELEGERFHWEMEVSDDWVDPTLFTRFAHLMEQRDTTRRFSYLDLEGQDCIIGCCTPEQLAALRKETGLRWQWLS